MDRKRTSSQRSTIVTDVKSSDDHTPKTLKLSLSGTHKAELFLFDAQPEGNLEVTISTLLHVTEHNVHNYSSEPEKALNHINLLWKSFSDNEPISLVLLRIFRQIVLSIPSLSDSVRNMLQHFVDNGEFDVCAILECVY